MTDAKVSIEQFLDAAAARQPTPGGGSVSALVGALASSMGEMVLNYSVNKKGLEAFADELKPALAEFHKARLLMLQLMVEDQAAYEAMSAIRKLPADSKERIEKFPAALLAGIRVPQAMGAAGLAVLHICDRVINFVNPYLLSDLAVCADLAMATVRCANYNVQVNLPELTDPADRQSIEAAANQVLIEATMLIRNLIPRIWDRHGQNT